MSLAKAKGWWGVTPAPFCGARSSCFDFHDLTRVTKHLWDMLGLTGVSWEWGCQPHTSPFGSQESAAARSPAGYCGVRVANSHPNISDGRCGWFPKATTNPAIQTEVPRGGRALPNTQRRREIRERRLPPTSGGSWSLWQAQGFFQSRGIKAELLAVLCISASESPLLQPTGSGSKAGRCCSHLWSSPVLLSARVLFWLWVCSEKWPKNGAFVTAKANLLTPPPVPPDSGASSAFPPCSHH